jgi:hypothetical protein
MTPHPYQEKSIEHLLGVLARRNGAVDASDMGVGKTLVGVEIMKRADLPSLVVCPKAVMPGWKRTGDAQGIEFDILNYEMLRTGRTQYGGWRAPDLRHKSRWFNWHPGVKRIVWDEVQRCKGFETGQSELLKSARRVGIQNIGLSATLADTPMEMDAIGYALGLHDSDSPPTLRNPAPLSFYHWAHRYGCGGPPFGFYGGNDDMVRLNAVLFPDCGVRVKKEDLGDLFPETQITAELYAIDGAERLNALYADMAVALATLRARTDNYFMQDPFVAMLAERQKIELFKVPVFVDLTKDAVAQGMSVTIFVNFVLTLDEICKRLVTSCRIDGSQIGARGATIREANRQAFQDDEERVIACIGEAGGIGLDLHDVTGKHPRLSLISPGFNAKLLRQIFGRVQRVGGKSKSIQRVIFAEGTCEVGVHKCLSGKLNRLDGLQDGDLMPENLKISFDKIGPE